MTKQQMMEKMKLTALSDTWAAMFDEVYADYKERILKICDKEKLRAIIEEYNLFPDVREDILAAADAIVLNDAIALLTCLVDKAAECPENYGAGETEFPHGNTLEERFFLLIPLIHHIPEMADAYRAHGLPEEMVRHALTEYEGCIEIYKIHNGYTGFNKRYHGWTRLVMEARLFKLGRLNFEIRKMGKGVCGFKNKEGKIIALADHTRVHKSGQIFGSRGCTDEEGAFDAAVTETADAYVGYPANEYGRFAGQPVTLPKDEWELFLKEGDDIISVHIPRFGPLTVESCEAAYDMARNVFKTYYSEHQFKAFYCASWMMERKLGDILKPGSNVVAFQSKYTPFALPSSGLAVFTFVFQFPDGTAVDKLDYDQLPVRTSLQKEVQERYKKGDYIYENGGFFPFE